MKFFTDINRFGKIEFWLATVLWCMANLVVLSESRSVEGSYFSGAYTGDIIFVTAFYLTFLLLNFIIIPAILHKGVPLINLSITAVIVTLSFLFLPGFKGNFVVIFILGYYGVKLGLSYFHSKYKGFISNKNFPPGILPAVFIYLLLLFLMWLGSSEWFAQVLVGIIILIGLILYMTSFHVLIPKAQTKKNPFSSYLLSVVLFLIIASFPVGLAALLLTLDEDIAFSLTVINGLVQLLITAPFSWKMHKVYRKEREEFKVLETELGQSNANFDFLRSQINPHFLFNALNTIYGTAIQEKAERTSEGVQQLGDMMRFMLHENMQDKISLLQEIAYIKNYISLQKLRMDGNPFIQIQMDIATPAHDIQIAPMLLIPFVENAFKHGISLREHSPVSVALELKETILYFDVHNRIHKKENDPEKDKSGIGLINVKNRLQLLYPDKHELMIREAGNQFFVHLKVQLT